jgi:hypothetical protein
MLNRSNMSSKIKSTTFLSAHSELTPIVGKPNHLSIQKLKKQVFANAMANPCIAGEKFGYLGIVMPNDEYAAKQTKAGMVLAPFTMPTMPTIPNDDDELSVSSREENMRQYHQDKADYIAIESALRNQILAAIDELYISELEADDVGYGDYSPKEIIEYIVRKYDKIKYEDLQLNREKLEAKWDFTDPIQTLWKRIDECKKFSQAGGHELDDMTVMQATFKILQKTGIFETHCIIWKQKPEHTWTLDNFKDYFEEANESRNTATAKEVGYHGANKAATNSTPINEVEDNRYCIIGGKKIWQCWSHGGSLNPNHTSATCTNPKEGHIRESDWANLCGGSTEMLWSDKNRKFKNKKGNNSTRTMRNNSTAVLTTSTTNTPATSTYSSVTAANIPASN